MMSPYLVFAIWVSISSIVTFLFATTKILIVLLTNTYWLPFTIEIAAKIPNPVSLKLPGVASASHSSFMF